MAIPPTFISTYFYAIRAGKKYTMSVLSPMNRNNAMNGASSGSNAKMRIRAFPTVMDEAYVEQILEMLKNAIREIQRKNNGGLSFEELYRNAYTMVLHKHGERLYTSLRNVVEEHLRTSVRQRVAESLNGRFLETLNDAWSEHTVAMVMIRDIFMYMDRVYVEQNHVAPVYNLGVGIFRDEIVRNNNVSEHLRNVLLHMIAEERSGVQVNWMGIKHACAMLVALGLENTSVYEEEFERPFLAQSAEYYKSASQKFLEENSASSYVRKVEACLADEASRAKRYLDVITERKILDVLDDALITQHMQTIVDMENSGVVSMIMYDKVDDLKHLYLLLKRVDRGLQVITTATSKYLRSVGEKLVDELDTDEAKSPVAFIQGLLDLKEQFDHFLKDAFQDDAKFKQHIQSDFEYFFNKNKKSPEYLSSYIDDKLRKGTKLLSETELESLLDKAMVLFRFLQEKDVFERYYKSHLTKRLLLDKSMSDDAEKAMITRLRTECGCQFTLKLEGMFKDKDLWGTLNANLKEHLAKGNPIAIDLSVRVLTSGTWPTQTQPQCILPDPCQHAFKVFEEFYNKSHTGRKMTLNTIMGNADVKAVFYGAQNYEELSQQETEAGPSTAVEKRREEHKILQVTTHQMVVLMRFNVRSKFTFQELLADTQISDRELKKVLQSLAMGKASQRVLCRKGKGKDIDNLDEFSVNDGFTSKLTRIKISMISSKGDQEQERKETREKNDEDRKHEVEAAIVRIMKARKRLQHNSLVAEVTSQLNHRFKPNPQLIKKRIENLIEREYLVRNKDDHRSYEYVS